MVYVRQNSKAMNYKGFQIEEEHDPWALKTGSTHRWFIDGEKVHSATSLQDAVEQINEEIERQFFEDINKKK